MSDSPRVSGTQGYAARAEALVRRYESVPFSAKYEAVMHLLPAAPGRVLDVGAGTGADAAWFAACGHTVVAVEPTAPFRDAGSALHPSPRIEWLDDSLPGLASVNARHERFDVVMLSAVFMHLDEQERRTAMPMLAALLAPDGVLLMSLRHGPVPPGRRMFDVSGEETVALAEACGLRAVVHTRTESALAENRAAGVTWTQLAFRRRGEAFRSPAPG